MRIRITERIKQRILGSRVKKRINDYYLYRFHLLSFFFFLSRRPYPSCRRYSIHVYHVIFYYITALTTLVCFRRYLLSTAVASAAGSFFHLIRGRAIVFEIKFSILNNTRNASGDSLFV